MNKLILVLYFINMFNSQCGTGCLSCTSGDQCLLCDVFNGFYIQQSSQNCVRSQQTQCLTFDYFGGCLVCNTGYYFDYNLYKCYQVAAHNIDQNCLQYGLGQECVRCAQNFYVRNEQCTAVTTPINKCLTNLTDQICGECEDDYTLSLDQRSCVSNPVIAKCQAYTNVQCELCPAGFIQEDNLSKLQVQNLVGEENNYNLLEYVQGLLVTSLPGEYNCYLDRIDYCRNYQTFQVCEQCYIGYELYQGKCYRPSRQIIDNCAYKSSALTCMTCEQGYYLRGLSKCEEIQECQLINGCVEYDASAFEPICRSCDDGYVLTNNTCQNRLNTISFCDTYSSTSDTCGECASGKALTNDGTQCLDEITDCIEYEDSLPLATTLVCAKCKLGYYLNAGACQSGTVTQCQEYLLDENTCAVCENGYYLDSGSCLPHTNPVKDCEIQSQTELNRCDKCENGYRDMEAETLCFIGSIQFCKIYASENVCDQCFDGYTLVDDTTCNLTANTLIRSTPLFRSQGSCPDGQFEKDTSCQLLFEYEAEYCDAIDEDIVSTDLLDQECQICSEDSIPYNLKDKNVCLSQTELDSIYNIGTISISNCVVYQDDMTNSTIKCIQCQLGYYLTDTNTCSDTCPQNKVLVNVNFTTVLTQIKYTKISICVDEVVGVTSYVQDQDYDITPYQLDVGYQYEMELSRTDGQFKIIEPSQVPGTTTSTDLFQLHMHKSILNLTGGDVVNECLYYIDRGDSTYECQVCNFGFYSFINNVADIIDGCNSYGSDHLCDYCKEGYVLSSDRSSCTLSTVTGCIEYEVNTANCLLCDTNLYRQDLTTCTTNTINNCEFINKFQNTCLKCNTGNYAVKNSSGDIIDCQTIISDCITYQYNAGTLTCIECSLGNYPNINKTSCVAGTVTGCEEYDQSQTNVCLYYDNIIEFTYDQTCIDQPTIFGCLIYSNDYTSCQYCQTDKIYYDNEGLCCSPGTYPTVSDVNTSDCTGTNGQCKQFIWNGTAYICSECQSTYQLDPDSNECCPINNQYIGGSCQSSVSFNANNIYDCALFDFQNRICLGCISTQYLSNGICCDLGQFNNNGTCTDINISNCDQLSDDQTTCLECDINYFLQENTCCNITTQIYSYTSNTCIDQPTNLNCATFITQNTTPQITCGSCVDDTYYLVEGNIACCLKATSNSLGQYWNASANGGLGACENIIAGNSVDNCETYSPDLECLTCQVVGGIQLYPSNQYCCPANQTYAFGNCILTSTLYDNCLQVNKSNTDFCTQCDTNNYESNNICTNNTKYFPITIPPQDFSNPITQDITIANTSASPQCIQLSNDKSQCLLCADNYRLVPSDPLECCGNDQYYDTGNSQCIDIPTFNDNNCLLFNSETFTCLDGQVNNLYQLGMCEYNTIQYYILQNGTICCQYGQHEDAGSCVANTQGCLIQNGTDCLQCSSNYVLNGTTCNPLPPNCEALDNTYTQCIECSDGYQLQIDTSTQNCVDKNDITILLECNTVIIATNECTSCIDGYYVTNQNCCQYGYYYNTTNTQCEKIVKENCAVFINNKCNECFIDLQNCYSFSNIQYYYTPLENQISFQEQQVDIPIGFIDSLQIQQDNCCRNDQYFAYSQCFDIDISLNCQQGSLNSNGQFECSICNDGYYSSDGICCLVTQIYDDTIGQCFDDGLNCSDRYYKLGSTLDEDKLYESNGQCCRQYYYYDIQLSQCMPHPDPNCRQSDSQLTCNQCKNDTFEVSQFYIQSELRYNNSIYCNDRIDTYYFQPCLTKIDPSINTISNDNLQNYLNNCLFNIDFQCTQCNNGYYLKDSYCCADDEFHRDGICVSKSQALSNCVEFDTSINECQLCNTGYELSEKFCCLIGSVYDNMTNQCVSLPTGCVTYGNDLSICLKCDTNYYISNGYCCQYGTYHDTSNNTCVTYNNTNIENCLIGTIDTCYQCTDDLVGGQQVYESNGQCCLIGTYYNISNQQCETIGLPNCQFVNNSQDCIQCTGTNYSNDYNSYCCPLDFYYDGTSCVALNPECQQGYLEDGLVKCSVCNSGYVLSNMQCCGAGQVFIWSDNTCKVFESNNSGTLVNCKIPQEEANADGNTYCKVCVNGDFYLTDQITLQSDDFTLQNKNVCCPYKYAFDYQTEQCILIENLATSQYQLSNIKSCLEAYTFEDSATTKTFCIKCINLNQSISIEKIAGQFNQLTGGKRVQCYNDNTTTCSAFYEEGNTITDCLYCSDPVNQYLGTKTCCNRGTEDTAIEVENNGTCVAEASTSNCAYYENSICQECITGYYILNNACVAELINDPNNCLRQDGSGTCTRCIQGYYITNSNTCLPIESTNPALNNCSANELQQCVQCFDGLILTNNACCLEGQIFDAAIGLCVSLSFPTGCLQVQNGICVQCDVANDYYIILNDQGFNWCCPVTQIVVDDECIDPTDPKLTGCNVFEDNNTCRILTDEEKSLNSLQDDCINSTQYVTNGSCCDLGSTFSNGSCVTLISINPNYNGCQKINEQGDCILCTNNTFYVTNGRCCTIGQYFNGTECIGIDNTLYPNCNQFQDQCTNCSSGLLTDGCCGINTTNLGTQCINNLTNCSQMLNTTQCEICNTNYYLSNDICCINGQVNFEGTCQSITSQFPNLTDCIQIEDFTVPVTDAQCQQCDTNKTLTNGRCCELNEYYDIILDTCVSFNILDNCANIQSDYTCSVCDFGLYLSSGKCCAEQQYFNTTNETCQNISITGCNQQDENQRCKQCDDGYYIITDTNNTNQCCLYGMPPNDTNCTTLNTSVSIQNCIDFNSSNTCIQCNDNSNLQNDICCPASEVLIGNDSTLQQCILIDKLISNCLDFNTLTLLCDTCANNYYRYDTQYMCCQIGQHYDSTTESCIANSTQCEIQIDDDCQQCASGNYLNGISGSQQCCPEGQYLDSTGGSPTCTNIGITNCLTAIQNLDNSVTCTSYDTSSCSSTQVYDRQSSTCVAKLQNCNIHGYDSSDNIICLECNATYILGSDQETCCPQNQFYLNDDTCSATLNISSTDCATIDTTNLECSSCRDQKYLSDGICCDYGTYKLPTDTLTCTGTISDLNIQNCDIYLNSSCQQCQTNYVFNSSDECISIYPNCTIFDGLTESCLLCNSNTLYITNGYCCPLGQKYLDNTCKTPDTPIAECQQYTDNSTLQCKVCSNNYYNVNQQFCCGDGNYCADDSSSDSGQISNCKEYGNNVQDCTRCDDGHSLSSILDDNNNIIDYCIAYQTTNCLYSYIIPDSNTNKIICDQCDNGKILSSVSSTTDTHTYNPDSNCLYYNIKQTLNQSTLQCEQCNDNYYLDNSNLCQSRSLNYTGCIQKELNKDECKECDFTYELQTDGTCQVITLTNCQQAATSTECALCQAGSIFIGDTTTLTDYTCVLESSITDYDTDGTPSINTLGYLDQCIVNNECSDQYLNGLNPEISKYLSCHVCNDTSEIPFIQLRFQYTSDNQLENGILLQEYFDTNLSSLSHSSECLQSNLSQLNLSDTTTYVFPSNCGIGIINGEETLSLNQTDQSTIDINNDKLSIFCGACKPGYAPTYSNLNYHVISCTLISDCLTYGSAFNQCDQCNDNYAFLYDSNDQIDKTQCILVPAPQVNCYAYDNTDCQVCKDGYNFNVEGICEALEIPKCKIGESNMTDIYQQSQYQLAYYRQELGCSDCQDGYFRFLQSIDDFVCIYSPYVVANDFPDTPDSFLVEDCKKYINNSGTISCYECDTNFVITTSGQCVPLNNNLQNCIIATNENECDTCINNDYFLNSSNVCTLKDIDNCVTYTDTQDEEACEVCEPYYYLDGTQCTRGQINGCIIYIDQNNCDTCDPSYELETNQQGNQVCIPALIGHTCQQFDLVKFAQGILSCQQCADGYFPKFIDPTEDICYPLVHVDGCIEYDTNISYPEQIPQCKRCESNYYLQDGKCFLRQFNSLQCIEFNPLEDQCLKCQLGYYPIYGYTVCEKQLDEILGCRLYQRNGECEVCETGLYLTNGGECQQVDISNIVENCYDYDSTQTCQSCNPGCFLLNNQCYKECVIGCKVYDTPTTCSECHEGYMPIIKNNILTCRRLKYIKNCRKMQNESPYYCEACQEGYYPSKEGRKCNKIKDLTKLVQNCWIYNELQQCAQCKMNYALTLDNRQCILIEGYQRCLDFQELDEPICGLCEEGYSLNDDNQCVQDSNVVANCLVPRLDDTTKCGICKPGYYMNSSYVCTDGSYGPITES